MVETITSKNNKKVKDACSIDPKGNLFLAEGFHLLEMALEAGVVESIFALEPCEADPSIPQYIVTDEIMRKICSTKNPEGIAALCRKKAIAPISSYRVLMLDGVADPGNVGTLLRTALAFGFDDVILTKGSSDPYNPKAIQASQGAIFKLNVLSGVAPAGICPSLIERGYHIFATSLQASLPLESFPPVNEKLVLVLGNEARGVSKEALSYSEASLRISMKSIDSLNVGVAGGIAMHHWRNV